MTETWSATLYEANGRCAALLGIPDRAYRTGSVLTDVTLPIPFPIEAWDAIGLDDLVHKARALPDKSDSNIYDPKNVYGVFGCSSEREWKAALRCEVRVYNSDDGTWEIDAIGRIKRGEGVRARVILNEVAPSAERLSEAFAEAVEWSRRVTQT